MALLIAFCFGTFVVLLYLPVLMHSASIAQFIGTTVSMGVSAGIASVVSLAGYMWIRMSSEERAQASAVPLRLRLSSMEAHARIARALRVYRFERRQWNLKEDKPNVGRITAVLEYSDLSVRNIKWLFPTGRVEYSIMLHVLVVDTAEGCEVQLVWDAQVEPAYMHAAFDRVRSEVTAELTNRLFANQPVFP